MLKVMEAFSGIGAQAKALSRLGIKYEIVATVDWDINAIIAYDLIHHGKQELSQFDNMDKQYFVEALKKYTLSPDGKEAYKKDALSRCNLEILKRVYYAIERSNNLVSITDMTWKDIPEDLDVLTYSFPCQDLSIAGVWHGNMSGIDRSINNRSGMLWEVERILKECCENERKLPEFLLMENVNNIMSPRHMGDFQEWIDYLGEIGYFCKIYKLSASKFGIPQDRKRVFMLSVYIGEDILLKKRVEDYFLEHNLEDDIYSSSLLMKKIEVSDIIKSDYKREVYMKEAIDSQLHSTPSRKKIIEENDKILHDGEYVKILKTITTKQDRNPNTGVIEFEYNCQDRENWRYLTPRECFISMGFEEEDFEILVSNNVKITKNRKLFSDSKLIKMAGNSIVVNVLEAIFTQVLQIRLIKDDLYS